MAPKKSKSSQCTNHWSNLVSAKSTYTDPEISVLYKAVITHKMRQWVKVASLYHYLYIPPAKGDVEGAKIIRVITLKRILSMMDSIENKI